MLGFLFLVGFALLGSCLTRRLIRGLLTLAEQILWGTVIGWTLSAILVYFIARWQGHLSKSAILIVTILAWAVAAVLLNRDLRSVPRAGLRSIWRREYTGLTFLLLVFAPIYWRLFSTHMFAPGADGVYSGGGAWYDLSFHSALTSSFAYGHNFPPIYPLLPPEPLLYPYLPDFQNAILIASGLSLRASLLSTSLVLALTITGLFYFLALRMTRGIKPAVLATVLFLLNGGLGFIYFISDWWKSSRSLAQAWNTLDVNYTGAPARGLYWTNLIDLMPGQRTLLFGIPLTLLIVTILAMVWSPSYTRVTGDDSGHDANSSPPDHISTTKLLLIAGGVTGLLPLFHTHSYIAVGVVCVVLFLLQPGRKWLIFWAPAVLLAVPQLWMFGQRAAGGGVVKLQLGWMGTNDAFFPWYLLRDFGLPLLLVIPAWFAAPKPWRKFYLAFLALFVFALSVIVSPNSFDNGKFFYYWHGLNSVLVAAWLIRVANVNWRRALAALITFICIASGMLALQYEHHNWSRIFTVNDMAAADYVRLKTSPRSLFLAAPIYNQPPLCLAGRAVLLAHPTWLWSHGYEFREREADVRRIYAGTSDALDLLRYYQVDYIYLSEAERAGLKANESFFENNFVAVYRNSGVTIFDARRSPADSTAPLEPRTGSLHKPAPRELAWLVDRDPYALLAHFPRTSFFVYRLYKAAYGRMPRRSELMPAMKQIGQGVFIGRPGWQEQLELNRNAFLASFVNGSEFKQFYDHKTNADFVNTLLNNAGLNWSANKRTELATRLDTQADSRVLALLSIAEDRTLFQSQYNNAYVLMHFFGYLRRNPDDPPDGDLRGLIFWRDVLDKSGEDSWISRAFIESLEYNDLRPLN